MINITRIRDHFPKRCSTRKFHDEMEARKKETTEKLRREVRKKQRKKTP